METTSAGSDFRDLLQTTSVLEIVGDMIRVCTDKATLARIGFQADADIGVLG